MILRQQVCDFLALSSSGNPIHWENLDALFQSPMSRSFRSEASDERLVRAMASISSRPAELEASEVVHVTRKGIEFRATPAAVVGSKALVTWPCFQPVDFPQAVIPLAMRIATTHLMARVEAVWVLFESSRSSNETQLALVCNKTIRKCERTLSDFLDELERGASWSSKGISVI